MPERTRQVLEMCCYENMTYKEVAETMSMSSSTVKKHITTAYAMLREHFKVKKK